MQEPEFRKILEQVKEDKRRREEYEKREKELRIKHADDRRRRSSMERPKITYIPKGLTVDYYNRLELLIEEEAKIVSGYRASLLDRTSKL